MDPVWFLLVFITCAFISLLLSWIAKVLFPKFRSGEYKPGTNLSDFPASEQEYQTVELPLVGGLAITLSTIIIGVGAGFLFNLHHDQWILLLTGLGASFGYMLVGFIYDWHKVYSSRDLSENIKIGGVLMVSMAATFVYFFLLPAGREPLQKSVSIGNITHARANAFSVET
jgi:UDP-N-acetylmuramyl pentapeptide phosphotransferase/UDP-N-acetylglucosamine-1-phosphate transferase